jgi:hypothetical protein
MVTRLEKILEIILEALDRMPADDRLRACNAILEGIPADVHAGLTRRYLDRGLSVREYVTLLSNNPRVVPVATFRPLELSPSRSILS